MEEHCDTAPSSWPSDDKEEGLEHTDGLAACEEVWRGIEDY